MAQQVEHGRSGPDGCIRLNTALREREIKGLRVNLSGVFTDANQPFAKILIGVGGVDFPGREQSLSQSIEHPRILRNDRIQISRGIEKVPDDEITFILEFRELRGGEWVHGSKRATGTRLRFIYAIGARLYPPCSSELNVFVDNMTHLGVLPPYFGGA